MSPEQAVRTLVHYEIIVSDAVPGFLRDLARLGKAEHVAMLIFSEFGRRVPENANLGTANYVFLVGQRVRHLPDVPGLVLKCTEYPTPGTCLTAWLARAH